MMIRSNIQQRFSWLGRGRGGRGFSLVEALATVAIIGIVTFLALPNIVKMRRDAEKNMAMARAEAFNLGVAAYVQAQGTHQAAEEWAKRSGNEEDRYQLITPYLAFAPDNLRDYVSPPFKLRVTGYVIDPKTPLGKVVLEKTDENDPETEKPPLVIGY